MEEIEITEDVIMDVAAIIGENDFFYYVTGYGGCNTCSEYFAFYSKRWRITYGVHTVH
jgi:hypothetical protein